MRVVAFVKGARAVACLEQLLGDSTHEIALLVAQPGEGSSWFASTKELAQKHQIDLIVPENPHEPDVLNVLRQQQADVFLLLGYGYIVKKSLFEIPKLMTINLHGGALPQMRGSSPLNWALILGKEEFTLSVIKVDGGVDTGDVLLDRTFPIAPTSSIKDLHKVANSEFPEMLIEALQKLESGSLEARVQDEKDSAYYPLRFPEDGFIVWDSMTAEEVHNRVRALTKPYPPAFTYFDGRRVNLIATELLEEDFFGEAGRVYRVKSGGLLVCAKDRCLWVTEAIFADDETDAIPSVERYATFPTLREMLRVMAEKGEF